MNYTINDNEETITCRLCGEQCKRIYGIHMKNKHKGITTDDYRRMFPGAPITSPLDKMSTSKNSGKHMKDEKYKKMFSEMFSGENNPNHKTKTTEIERKKRSPFSKEFVKYEDIENVEDHISKFAKEAIKDRIGSTTVEYFINKGYSEEEAQKMLSERQRTFSLEKCIEKWGNYKGKKIWENRQEKWQKSLLDNGNIKCGFSKISQELFHEIIKNYSHEETQGVYYATKNKEYYISKKNTGFFSYDFVDINRKKIIEYNGDEYHANPNKYSENDYPHPFYKENGPTAKQIWERDEQKINIAKQEGFEVLVVWDSEWRKNKEDILTKCIEFIKK